MGGRHAATNQTSDRDFKERSVVVLAVSTSRRPPLGVCLFLSLLAYRSSQFLANCILAATFMPPRGLLTLVVLSPAASSSDSSLSLREGVN